MAEQAAGQDSAEKEDEAGEGPPATRLSRLRKRTLALPDGRYLLLYSRPAPDSPAHPPDPAPK